MTTIRVTSPASPGYTRNVRSWAWAEERARRVARLAGSSEIQRRDAQGAWETIERYACTPSGRVLREDER